MRKAFVIKAKAGQKEEYIKRHNPIWDELKIELKNYGITNYSIFCQTDSNLLFGYFEIENEKLFETIEDSQILQNWWKYMKEVLVSEDENSIKAKEIPLIEIFHLD
ncbi:L-rhamnose mutarotase [Membranihabitans marinus]|uniref:L-rhamnose mutarotase n=1 Tax=Membranihabitans marinus TaxID=1227546 RepID=UPI001F0170EC|nr:L-rhamnose mutarotase [Membranihabitans marinus]